MKELKIAIDEFKNLNILNDSLSFNQFTNYINSTKVLLIVEKILQLLNKKNNKVIPIINSRIFISGWYILKYCSDIFTNKNDLEKLIIEKIIAISKIIVSNNINTEEDIDNFVKIVCEYEKQFILWKNLDKTVCINEFVNRYTSINKSITLITNSSSFEAKQNIIQELENQKNDVIEMAIKFDKKINKEFFDKSYEIYSKVEKITEEAYWKLMYEELQNNNYNLVISNLEFIINTLCTLAFNGDNVKKVFDIEKINEKLNNNDHEYFFILANSFYYQWRKLSSPFRNIDYNKYILQLDISNEKKYFESIINFIKNNLQIIDNIYLDLLFLKIN
jgi:hypothetical protein